MTKFEEKPLPNLYEEDMTPPELDIMSPEGKKAFHAEDDRFEARASEDADYANIEASIRGGAFPTFEADIRRGLVERLLAFPEPLSAEEVVKRASALEDYILNGRGDSDRSR